LVVRGSEAKEVEIRVTANRGIREERGIGLLKQINIAKRLEEILSCLATNVEPNSAGANCAQGGGGSIILPGNGAERTSRARGGGNRGGDVEVSESLGGHSSGNGSGENGSEHG